MKRQGVALKQFTGVLRLVVPLRTEEPLEEALVIMHDLSGGDVPKAEMA